MLKLRSRCQHLHFRQVLLLLPVPHGQDVIVGIIHGAEEGPAVLKAAAKTSSSGCRDSFTIPGHQTPLTDLEKDTQVTALSNTPIPITWMVLRLTESQMRT